MNKPTPVEAAQELLEQEPALSQLKALEALRSPLLRARVALQTTVWAVREQYRLPNYKPDPKDKDTPRYTDFDRRTMLDAQTSEAQSKYELARGYEDLVRERIQLLLNVNWSEDVTE